MYAQLPPNPGVKVTLALQALTHRLARLRRGRVSSSDTPESIDDMSKYESWSRIKMHRSKDK